jgi:hypothetical protein
MCEFPFFPVSLALVVYVFVREVSDELPTDHKKKKVGSPSPPKLPVSSILSVRISLPTYYC